MTRALIVVCVLANAAAAEEPHGEKHEAHHHGIYAEHDACEFEIADPVPTPIHDGGIDDQRAACLRTEIGAIVTTHALIDTPEFHGVIGGDVTLDLRHVFHAELELGARLRMFDLGYVQTAVNKVTETRYGPLLVSAAWGRKFAPSARWAIVAAAEVPYTRNEMETMHTAGELTAYVTGALSTRWTVHGRLGALAALASSGGGQIEQLAMRAGIDLAWRSAGSRIGLVTGVETQAGFTGGLDTVMLREGFQLHVGQAYRFVVGVALPLAGNDQTNLIAALGLAREL